jgi:large conductance mechanosensitive channel
MQRMKIWRQFKAFALSGSMLDLALGFLIGTAFAAVVDSATKNILMPLIAAAFGRANFNSWHGTIGDTRIPYGTFLTDMLTFFIFAATLFFMLKFFSSVGLGRNRDFEEKQCPYCLEYVPPRALVCRICRQPLVAQMPDLATAEARAAELRRRHHLKLPDIDLPEFDFDVPVPKMRRRTATAPGAGTAHTETPVQPEHHE